MNTPLFKVIRIYFCCILMLSLTNAFAGKIIVPWRAKKEIVKQGNSFAIWYNKENGETVNSVELVGPYNIVPLTIDNNKDGSWYFDRYTEASYNCSLSVTVPAGTPVELYDLYVKTSAGDFMSRSAVKVVNEYQSHYYICHFTDPHVSVCWGDDGNVTAPIMQALAEIIQVLQEGHRLRIVLVTLGPQFSPTFRTGGQAPASPGVRLSGSSTDHWIRRFIGCCGQCAHC